MDTQKGGYMKHKYTLLAICSFLSINMIMVTAIKNSPEKESLKQVLEFINKKSGQKSPVFDLSAKPYFDHAHEALDRVIQKATDDKYLNPQDNSATETELAAHQQQNILEQLYKKDPSLFLSLEELTRKTKPSKHISVKEETPSVDFAEPSVYESLAANQDDNSAYHEFWSQEEPNQSSYEESPTYDEAFNDYPYQEQDLDNNAQEYDYES